MKRRLLAWSLPVLYCGLIWFLSSLSVVQFPSDQFPLRDKGVHFFEFGGLAGMLAFAITVDRFDLSRARRATFAIAAASAFGALDEVHQAFVPGRSSELLDWVADTAGAVVWGLFGVALFAYVLPRVSTRYTSEAAA